MILQPLSSPACSRRDHWRSGQTFTGSSQQTHAKSRPPGSSERLATARLRSSRRWAPRCFTHAALGRQPGRTSRCESRTPEHLRPREPQSQRALVTSLQSWRLSAATESPSCRFLLSQCGVRPVFSRKSLPPSSASESRSIWWPPRSPMSRSLWTTSLKESLENPSLSFWRPSGDWARLPSSSPARWSRL